MTLKENLNLTCDTYRVIFSDTCAPTKDGSVFKRIHKGIPFSRVGLNHTEDEIFEMAQRGGRGLGKKRITSWIKNVEECATYNQLAALDPDIQDIRERHDIWKHCGSIYKGKKQNSCWEFDIGGYCRMMCYIDHATKQVLVMDGAFTESEHAVEVMYERLSDLGDEIFMRTHETPVFEQIKQDAAIVKCAEEVHEEITHENDDNYQFGIKSIDDFSKALKALRQVERAKGMPVDTERKAVEKEFFESMKLLYETDANIFNVLHQNILDEQKNRTSADERSSSLLRRLPTCVLGYVQSVMQRITDETSTIHGAPHE